jgi:acid phosphatase
MMPSLDAVLPRPIACFLVLALAAGSAACGTRAAGPGDPAEAGAPAAPADEGQQVPASAAAALNGTLWMQHGAGYVATSLQTYALAEQALRRALEDSSRTAALEQEDRDVAELPPAVILDVDETVLDNSPYNARRILAGAGFTPESFAAWTREAAAEPVPGALAFTRTADSLGVAVFYVTNRDHGWEEATARNLRRLGFPLDTTSDHLLTEGEREGWGSDKTSRRARVARDHRVLIQLGDDLNDFVDARGSTATYRRALEAHRHRFGESWFMLPNPAYGSWEGAVTGFGSGLSPEETVRRKLRSLDTAEEADGGAGR